MTIVNLRQTLSGSTIFKIGLQFTILGIVKAVQFLMHFLKTRKRNDIFNVDEMSLFYKCLIDETLAWNQKYVFGVNDLIEKIRVTVLLADKTFGTETLKILANGKSKKQKWFAGIKSLLLFTKTINLLKFLKIRWKNLQNFWRGFGNWLVPLIIGAPEKFKCENREVICSSIIALLSLQFSFISLRHSKYSFFILIKTARLQPQWNNLGSETKL